MPDVYYNDNDRNCAAWLGELIAAGHLPQGHVDQRSIADVSAADLDEYGQAHFFAGIGGWPYALSLAGWPAGRPVWTASLPCQPFSAAGKQRSHRDERHLWPVFRSLVAECHPPTIFGEQVSSALGRQWLARVRADLEEMGYAVGAVDLCAAGVGAPHIRQRLFWVADAECGATERHRHEMEGASRGMRGEARQQRLRTDVGNGCATGGLADAKHAQRWTVDLDRQDGCDGEDDGWAEAHSEPGARRKVRDSWSDFTLIPCADGKARRVKSGLQPLAHGVPARVGRLRGYGNAIVAPLAAKFIEAFMSCAEAER